MYKLNHLQYPKVTPFLCDKNHSLEALQTNEDFYELQQALLKYFNFEQLNTFSFSEDGFIALLMKLSGKIAVSLGESQAIVSAAQQCQAYGLDITFLELKKDGSVNLEALENSNYDYIFISSYVMDTFIKTDLTAVKALSSASLISNISASFEYIDIIDMVFLDIYKLTGFQTHSILLHNHLLPEQFLSQYDGIALAMIHNAIMSSKNSITIKKEFQAILEKTLGDSMFYFVDNNKTLSNSLHFGLKGIKAREIIRTLALSSIFITNGEGCSLGLSQPSRVIQAMGYLEDESRQAISLSFDEDLSEESMQYIANEIAKKYRQIIRFK